MLFFLVSTSSLSKSQPQAKRPCYLCNFTFTKKEKKTWCHCRKMVHADCFKGDGDSCPSAPLWFHILDMFSYLWLLIENKLSQIGYNVLYYLSKVFIAVLHFWMSLSVVVSFHSLLLCLFILVLLWRKIFFFIPFINVGSVFVGRSVRNELKI